MEAAVWVAMITALASVLVAAITAISGRAERREIKSAVEQNTQLTGQTHQEAKRTWSESNDLNRKIIELGDRLDRSITASAHELGEIRAELRSVSSDVSQLTGAAQHERGVLEGKLHTMRNQLTVLSGREQLAQRKAQREGASVIHTDKLEADELSFRHKDVKEDRG